MANDLVASLRRWTDRDGQTTPLGAAAADEIERLEATATKWTVDELAAAYADYTGCSLPTATLIAQHISRILPSKVSANEQCELKEQK